MKNGGQEKNEGEECSTESLLGQNPFPFFLARHPPTERLENADLMAIEARSSHVENLSGVTYGLCGFNETIPTILNVMKPSNNHVAVIIRVLYGPFALPFMWPRPPQEVQLT